MPLPLPLTTADVLRALEAAGWRWETANAGLPMLTNAPVNQTFCPEHGGWVESRHMKGAICHTCYNTRQTPHPRGRICWWKWKE